MVNISEEIKDILLQFQKNEITEHFIYKRLANVERNDNNRKILGEISQDELKHYGIWKSYSGKDVKPNIFKIFFYFFISKIFGVMFAIKLMEIGETGAQRSYEKLESEIPEAKNIKEEEEIHENKLINMIDEERLKYIGSVVLGLNDALVELTGTLAGLTFALQNSRLIGMAGLITGIAASLSMAASEYLSTKSEGGDKNPLRASLYTGVAYVIAVSFLILPFLLIGNYFLSLLLALLAAILLIFIFTFYFSVVKEISFRERFFEMVLISLGVAALSFGIGLLVRIFLGIEV